MTDDAAALAALLGDALRRIEALERGSNVAASSVEVDGEDVRIEDGIRSALAAEAAAAEAIDAAASADAKADGKVQTFYGGDQPDPVEDDLGVGDFWLDDLGDAHMWDGAVWSPVTSSEVRDALLAAEGAQATADGKVTTFYAPSAPVAEGVGDVWVDSSRGNLFLRWDGSVWTEMAAGAEAIAPLAIQTSHLSDEAITPAKILAVDAESILDGSLKAAVMMEGSLSVTGTDGTRIYLDPFSGFSIVRPDSSIAINLPASSTRDNTIDGNVTARGLTTMGRASFRGTDNEISRASSLLLAAGTTRPSNAPTLQLAQAPATTASVTMTPDQAVTGDSRLLGRMGGSLWSIDGALAAKVVHEPVTSGVWPTKMRLEVLDNATSTVTLSPVLALPTGMTRFKHDTAFADDARAVRVGSEWVVLAAYSPTDQGTLTLKAVRYNATTWAKAGEFTVTRTAGTVAYLPSLATDGTSIYVGEGKSSSTAFTIRKFTTAGALSSTIAPVITGLGASGSGSANLGLCPVVGNFDFGSLRFMVSDAVFGQGVTAVVTATGTLNASEQMTSTNLSPITQVWRGGILRKEVWFSPSASTDGAVLLSRVALSTANVSRTVYAAYTWWDSDAAGGTHETDPSPVSNLTVPARSGLAVYGASPADTGSSDDPDGIKVYAGTASNALRFMSTVLGPNPSVIYPDPIFTGAAPPVANSFPAAGAAQILSANGGFVVKGDGTGAWPSLEDRLVKVGAVDQTVAGVKTFSGSVSVAKFLPTIAAVTYTAPWGAYGGGYAAEAMHFGGLVVLTFLVKPSASTSITTSWQTVATLPAGIPVPRADILGPCTMSGGDEQGRFSVRTNGTIQVAMVNTTKTISTAGYVGIQVAYYGAV